MRFCDNYYTFDNKAPSYVSNDKQESNTSQSNSAYSYCAKIPAHELHYFYFPRRKAVQAFGIVSLVFSIIAILMAFDSFNPLSVIAPSEVLAFLISVIGIIFCC